MVYKVLNELSPLHIKDLLYHRSTYYSLCSIHCTLFITAPSSSSSDPGVQSPYLPLSSLAQRSVTPTTITFPDFEINKKNIKHLSNNQNAIV